jgi:predicted TPR repeat methyltransferase
LRQALNGKEQTVLDFGCGAGRFTGDLFALVNRGAAVGFDVSEDLLTIARGSVDRATFIGDYSVLSSDQYAEYFDVIVVLTVIGGFSDALCVETASLLTTRLKPEGLLFLAENTAEDIRGNGFWTLRPVSWYQELFREVDLNVASKYWDLGAEVSIMTGRKKAIGSSTTR